MRRLVFVAAGLALAASQVAYFRHDAVAVTGALLALTILLVLAAPRRREEPAYAPGFPGAPAPEAGGAAPAAEEGRTAADYAIWIVRGALAACALVLAFKAQHLVRTAPSPWVEGGRMFLYAGLLLMLACFRIERQEGRAYESSRWKIPLLLEVFLFLFVFGIGAYMRLSRITETPPGCWYDEALHGNLTLKLMEQKGKFPLFCHDDREPSLGLYVTAFWFKVLGPETLALRVTAASIGILTIPFFYFFLRSALNPLAALAGAFLLAVARWHINFSRINFVTSILAPFFIIATLYFFWRGMKSGKWRDFVLGGALLGMCTHSYQPAWLMGVFLPILFVFKSFLVRGFFRRFFWKFLVAGLLSLFFVVPLYLSGGKLLLFRYGETTIFKGVPDRGFFWFLSPAAWKERWPVFGPNLRTTVYMYNKDGDVNGRHNLPAWPVLEEWTAVLFGLGFMFVFVELCLCFLSAILDILARIAGRGPPGLFPVTPVRTVAIMAFVLFWFMILPGAITIEAPQALRTIGAIPAIFTLAALALFRVWQAVEGFLPGWWILRLAPAAVVAFGLFRIYERNYDEYFRLYANHRAVWSAFSPIDDGIGKFVKGIQNEVQVYSDHISHPTIEFVVGRHIPYRYVLPVPVDFLPVKEEPEKDVVFILLQFNRLYIPLFRQWYPGGKLTEREHTYPDGSKEYMFLAYRISRDEAQRVRGLRARYYGRGEEAPLERSEPKVAFAAGAEHPLSAARRAEFSGVLFVPGTGDYVVGIEAARGGSVELDGKTVASTDGGTEFSRRMPLLKGLHPVRVSARGGKGASATLLFGPDVPVAREVGRSNLHAVDLPASGLVGRFWQNTNWEGRPTFHWVCPRINYHWNANPLDPWSAEWEGAVDCPRDGRYVFGLDSAFSGELWLDGKAVVALQTENRGMQTEGAADLKAGRHDLRVRFKQSYCDLYWTPPQGVREIIPETALSWRPEHLRWKEPAD